MIVIGGAHSANSLHLAELCREKCASVFFVADASELDTSRLPGEGRIGITAGASVPSWIIKEVVKKMSDEIKVEQTTAEEVAATTETPSPVMLSASRPRKSPSILAPNIPAISP